MQLYDDGTIEAPLWFRNDVFGESFCGGVHMELHDLRDNSLLFSADSPTYCIGGKDLGGHENSATIAWRVATTPEIAPTYAAHPSLRITAINYSSNNVIVEGLGTLVNVLGQAAGGNGDD
jgi:hypothetical protein